MPIFKARTQTTHPGPALPLLVDIITNTFVYLKYKRNHEAEHDPDCYHNKRKCVQFRPAIPYAVTKHVRRVVPVVDNHQSEEGNQR